MNGIIMKSKDDKTLEKNDQHRAKDVYVPKLRQRLGEECRYSILEDEVNDDTEYETLEDEPTSENSVKLKSQTKPKAQAKSKSLFPKIRNLSHPQMENLLHQRVKRFNS